MIAAAVVLKDDELDRHRPSTRAASDAPRRASTLRCGSHSNRLSAPLTEIGRPESEKSRAHRAHQRAYHISDPRTRNFHGIVLPSRGPTDAIDVTPAAWVLVVRIAEVRVAPVRPNPLGQRATRCVWLRGIQPPSSVNGGRQPAAGASAIDIAFTAFSRRVATVDLRHLPQPSVPRFGSREGRGQSPRAISVERSHQDSATPTGKINSPAVATRTPMLPASQRCRAAGDIGAWA